MVKNSEKIIKQLENFRKFRVIIQSILNKIYAKFDKY